MQFLLFIHLWTAQKFSTAQQLTAFKTEKFQVAYYTMTALLHAISQTGARSQPLACPGLETMMKVAVASCAGGAQAGHSSHQPEIYFNMLHKTYHNSIAEITAISHIIYHRYTMPSP